MPPLDEVVTALEDALFHEGVGDPRDAAAVLAFLHCRFGARLKDTARAKDTVLATSWASFVRSFDEVVRDIEQLQDGLERCAAYGYQWHPSRGRPTGLPPRACPTSATTRRAGISKRSCASSPRLPGRVLLLTTHGAAQPRCRASRRSTRPDAPRSRSEHTVRVSSASATREEVRCEEAAKAARSIKVADRIERLRNGCIPGAPGDRAVRRGAGRTGGAFILLL